MNKAWPTFGIGTGGAAVCRFAVVLLLAALHPVVFPSLAGGGETADDFLDRLEYADTEIEETLADVDRRRGLLPPESRDERYARILSHGKNAFVGIRGDLRAAYTAVRSDFIAPGPGDPFADTWEPGRSRTSDFAMTRERIGLDIEIGDRWRAVMEFNLSGNSGPRPVYEAATLDGPDDPGYRIREPIHEAYIELRKAGHSGFGLKVGKFALPFGVAAKPDLFAQSYLSAPDLTGSYLMYPAGRTMSPRLPHASAALDPVLAVLAGYELRDIVRFEAALFQERRPGRNGTENPGGSGHRSFQVGASLLPLDGWELSVAFRNRHDRERGLGYWSNSPYRIDSVPTSGSRKNEQSFVAGLALEVPGTGLSLFAEYARGWNQGFNSHIDSHDVNLGAGYRLTPRLTLFGQYEWLSVDDRSWLVDDGAGGRLRDSRSNRLGRYLVAFEYEIMAGLTLEGGWQRESWRFRSDLGGAGLAPVAQTVAADMFYMSTRFHF